MKNYIYLGNSAYCYSNSTAMLLSSIGENILPSYIEVIGGVGIGAYSLPETNIAFLSGYSGLPDKAISRALTTLGFNFIEKAQDDPNFPPFDDIRKIIKKSPVILGPLDMGYLSYDPDYKHHFGIDHFVFVYGIENGIANLHDPAGFPNVTIELSKLALAWKAEKIQYKEGYYRYWTLPKRVNNPTSDEIYNRSINNFQEIYITGEKYAKEKGKIIDDSAILLMADNVKNKKLSQADIGMLTGFVFPLGARRTSDFSIFFKPYNSDLADLKENESRLLGLCQSKSVKGDWHSVFETLKEVAEIERQFKKILLSL